MLPFAFHPGPRLLSGAGRAVELAEKLPPRPVLFVTDAGVRHLGLPDPCILALEASGRTVEIFDAVEADPSRATLLAAVEAGRAVGAASVIGFGGGSPMDVAKLAAYLLGSGDTLDAIWGVDQATGPRLPLALVPTTAGTGSEATPISVITCEGGVKMGVNARPLTADWAVLDAELTLGLPRHVTAATGLDAIVHAVEAYTSARLKNPVSDALAREALRLLAANLLTACEQPLDRDARSAMLLGAHLAGLAFANAPVAGVHALAYPLGGLHHIPHGLSNALMLRHVLGHNLEAARGLYAELGPILDPRCAGEGTQACAARLIEGLDELASATGLPLRLRDHGIAQDEAPLLAREAMKQTRLLQNNPVEISQADAQRLYEAAW
ncbi:iron-containing alcohol dehydrogenase [uncultured Sphingomonas sp.]|uniref:iron-containing alcohol dehydrogenase n=1 Tax=uncultured Sphingomonas sp. TaxID=158754 RepID=UPI0025D5DEC2|nr:iron-containing alcohol dehydrogenase [uncultured Sphingomonas sp.]